ncbi:unnamed protein product [Rotaria sordida]|uniref:MI domain-containing protein n=1 Tax=Rotaria sordida TaxID=392033 RepID=A0A815V3A1_9BILA|nr:unnamed protein product [Rotaria sordida]
MFLTIDLNHSAEKCTRKLVRMNIPSGQEMEVCQIILNNCAQKRRYDPFFGLLGQRLCLLKTEYIECFEKAFQDQYDLAHHLENVKLKNVPKFFAYMLVTNSISWSVYENQQSIGQINTNLLALFRTMFLTIDLNHSTEKCTRKLVRMNIPSGQEMEVLRCICLTEEDTTSSSRVYIKSLFLELVKSLGGFNELNNCLTDPTLTEYFQGLFPRDNPKNTKFSINFFASIGLDGLTNELQEFLRTNPTPTPPVPAALSIKEKEDDHENQGHIEALHRELQIQQQNKQDKKNKKNSHHMV